MSLAVVIAILSILILAFVFRRQIIIVITGSIALVVCIFSAYFVLDNGGIGNWHIRDNNSLKQYDEAKENPKGTIEYLKDKISGNKAENPAKDRKDSEYGKSQSERNNNNKASLNEDKTDDKKIWSNSSEPISEVNNESSETKKEKEEKSNEISKNLKIGKEGVVIKFNQVSNFIDKNEDLLSEKDKNILKGITPLTSQKFKGDNVEISTKKSKVFINIIN